MKIDENTIFHNIIWLDKNTSVPGHFQISKNENKLKGIPVVVDSTRKKDFPLDTVMLGVEGMKFDEKVLYNKIFISYKGKPATLHGDFCIVRACGSLKGIDFILNITNKKLIPINLVVLDSVDI